MPHFPSWKSFKSADASFKRQNSSEAFNFHTTPCPLRTGEHFSQPLSITSQFSSRPYTVYEVAPVSIIDSGTVVNSNERGLLTTVQAV